LLGLPGASPTKPGLPRCARPASSPSRGNRPLRRCRWLSCCVGPSAARPRPSLTSPSRAGARARAGAAASAPTSDMKVSGGPVRGARTPQGALPARVPRRQPLAWRGAAGRHQVCYSIPRKASIPSVSQSRSTEAPAQRSWPPCPAESRPSPRSKPASGPRSRARCVCVPDACAQVSPGLGCTAITAEDHQPLRLVCCSAAAPAIFATQ